MAFIQETQLIAAPISQVWSTWNAFGEIVRFNPALRASALINGSKPTGLGAERQCDMKDGKNYIRERIVGYIPEERMEIDIYEGTLPIRDVRAVLDFAALAPARTRVTMSMRFTPRMGLPGLLLLPLMKPVMKRTMRRLLAANRDHVEAGGDSAKRTTAGLPA